MKAKATITVKGEIGQVFSLKHKIAKPLTEKGLTVQANQSQKEINIEGDISKEELIKILSKYNIDYSLDYQEVIETIKKPEEKSVTPKDYFQLKIKAKEQTKQIDNQKNQISDLEVKLNDMKRSSGNTIRSLNITINDLTAKCKQLPTVQDLVSETMIRENQSWENFVQFYDQTIKEYSELENMKAEELEKQCINYEELNERPGFQQKKEEYDRAKKLKQSVEENPGFVELTPKAKELLNEMDKVEKEEQVVKAAREVLMEKAENRIMRIALRATDKETHITLPFKFKKDYHKLEEQLVKEIEQSLEGSKLEYKKEKFNDLLRYEISGIKTRARNRLIKAISESEGIFTQLGGKRELIRIEIYS